MNILCSADPFGVNGSVRAAHVCAEEHDWRTLFSVPSLWTPAFSELLGGTGTQKSAGAAISTASLVSSYLGIFSLRP